MTYLKQLRKRGLALFLALVMCLSLVQVTALADEMTEDVPDTMTEETENPALLESGEEQDNVQQDDVQQDNVQQDDDQQDDVQQDDVQQGDDQLDEEPSAEGDFNEPANGEKPAGEEETSSTEEGKTILKCAPARSSVLQEAKTPPARWTKIALCAARQIRIWDCAWAFRRWSRSFWMP